MVMVSVPLFPVSLDTLVLLPLLSLGLLRDLESVALMLTLMLTIVMAMDIPMLTMVTMGMDVDTTGVK